MKYFSQVDILKNAIKPGVYLHIVYGCYASDILPSDAPSYIRDSYNNVTANKRVLPTEKQIDLLHKFGFMHTYGLTRKQASKLISIAIERDRQGLALPWQLQIITKGSTKSMVEKHERYSMITKREAMQIIEHIEIN